MYAWEYQFKDKDVRMVEIKTRRFIENITLDILSLKINCHIKFSVKLQLMPDFIENRLYHEIGYILKKEYWHNGFAAECAKALTDYAFKKLNLKEVIFEIRPIQ